MLHREVQGEALAFEQIEKAMQTLEQIMARQTLPVSTVTTFAASWLVPRLGRFNQRSPHIEVGVEATLAVVDMRRDRVDVALRHGLGVYPGLHVTHLIAPVLVPVACPGLTAANLVLKEPEDCLNYPLLHDCDRADWPLWLAAHGVTEDPRAERGTAFEDDFLLIRAAEAGQGVALVPSEYAQDEIAAGRLVQVLDKPWPRTVRLLCGDEAGCPTATRGQGIRGLAHGRSPRCSMMRSITVHS
ncbi:LysR substrate-binding domain-containing protein [Pseudomonas fluorescens]|uniref:LysR substrate-binding domain-containing protein n=1 Tax=Pseudomonas fluorescens TaxID=294 RepID=A0A5E7VU77_PSEFL|nr:LysR substrate-binding domain-containing protein [Pseudomonas fluorescens]VVQ26459.1 hypothetical protein PS928_06621 [Pseudomonas fluorescens]